MLSGQNCCLNPSIVNVFLDHEPQSTATKNMIHLSQSKWSYFPNLSIMQTPIYPIFHDKKKAYNLLAWMLEI